MDLPLTENGNKHVVVFQDFLTKWPMDYPIIRLSVLIDYLLSKLSMFGVPEALLSDIGVPISYHI